MKKTTKTRLKHSSQFCGFPIKRYKIWLSTGTSLTGSTIRQPILASFPQYKTLNFLSNFHSIQIPSISPWLFRGYSLEAENTAFYIYIAVTLSVTPFTILSRILTELKLLSSDISHISLFKDQLSWVPLALVIAIKKTIRGEKGTICVPSPLILLSTFGFVLVCIFLVQPAMKWLVHKTPEGEEAISNVELGAVIVEVMAAGYITDVNGIHSSFGAFIYSLVFPHGPHATALVKRLEYFVMGLLLPLYFSTSRIRTELSKIEHTYVINIVIFIIILSSIAKVVINTLVAMSHHTLKCP